MASNFPSSIQAVTFDAGGTLIEPWPSVGHIYASVAARHGVSGLDAATLNHQFATAWRNKRRFDYSQTAWFGLVRETFGELENLLAEACLHELYHRFTEAEAWRIYDDVLPALDNLAAHGVRLAVISNWDERLHPLLDNLKLRSYFEAVIISRETGFAKPSPVIFEHALRKLGLPAAAVLHVGNSLDEDVQGAQAAGCRSLRIDRQKNSTTGSIASLLELTQALN